MLTVLYSLLRLLGSGIKQAGPCDTVDSGTEADDEMSLASSTVRGHSTGKYISLPSHFENLELLAAFTRGGLSRHHIWI